MRRVLVRADDLGYCEAVNYGIAKSVHEGIIRSVGLMPSMEAAAHGVELLKGTPVCYGQHTNICEGRPLTDPAKIPIIRSVGLMPSMEAAAHGVELLKGTPVCYGQHTNICEGRPLTDPAKIPSLVQENGLFKNKMDYRQAKEDFVVLEEVLLEIEAQYQRFVELNGLFKNKMDYRQAKEDFVVLEEVLLEIEAQYQRFVELVGDKPHYLEAHAVPSANLFRGLEIVAQRHGLHYLGMDPRGGSVRFRNSQLYVSMDSMKPDYDPFESLKEAALRDVGEDGYLGMDPRGGSVRFRNSQLYVSMDSMKPDYDPFESLKEAALRDVGEDGCVMMVCHPGYVDEYVYQTSYLTRQRAMEVAMCTAPETKAWLEENQVQLVTYDDL